MFLASIFAVFLLIPLNGSASTLKLVTLQYPPYEFEKDGEIKGIAVEIIREAFSRMNQPITISLHPWATALGQIENGEADAIFTAFKTSEREKFADYSREVLLTQTISLFVGKKSNMTFDGDLRKMNRYAFGVVLNISYGSIFDDAVKNGIITKLVISDSAEVNMHRLLEGSFDILVSNTFGAMDILRKMDAQDHVKQLKPSIQRVPSYIAFSKKNNLISVRDRFDRILQEMIKDGSYNRIVKSYFDKGTLH
ncbi:MAG: transporter substrate-binding domain-containing protein [Deltaproteobacteria bacterium]|nr:transporter substrate-binding domain-containing protein [Deltaproteobacteria bacterium]